MRLRSAWSDGVRNRRDRSGRGTWSSVLQLLGHMLASSVLFVAFLTMAWLTELAFHSLHAIRPFPDETFRLLSRLEISLIYADAIASAIILIVAITQFCREVLK